MNSPARGVGITLDLIFASGCQVDGGDINGFIVEDNLGSTWAYRHYKECGQAKRYWRHSFSLSR